MKRQQLNELLNRPKEVRTNEQEETSNPSERTNETAQSNNEENIASRNYAMPNQNQITPMQMPGLRFNDVKGSFRSFKGEPGNNVRRWIQHFEENAEIFQLNDLQKLIFAKNLFEGQARLFADYESKAHSWQTLRNELIEEFEKQSNSLVIHQQLAARRKATTETAIQYLYDMIILGSQGNVDIEAIFTHTTNGMPGNPQNKTILYEAKNLNDYKNSLLIYELQQNQVTGMTSQINESRRIKQANRRCINCGDLKHGTIDCPHKMDGPKCFRCNNFGHRSMDDVCPMKNENPRHNTHIMITSNNIQRSVKNINIGNHMIASIVDTGSDISLMQEKTHQLLGLPEWIPYEEFVNGVGATIKTMGYLMISFMVDDIMFKETFRIIQNQEHIPQIILGIGILNQADIQISSKGIRFMKKPEEQKTANNFPVTSTEEQMIIRQPGNGNMIVNLWQRIRHLYQRIQPFNGNHRQKTVIIEGNIGAGKTTLTRRLHNNVDFLVIPEPIDLWHNIHGFNLLKAYYEDKTKWAMTFQSYAMLTMLQRHWYSTTQKMKIMERSLMS